jgi:small subunit ribosomal protein S6
VADDEIPGQLDAISGYVTSAGGAVTEVNRESPWGRRRLAYAIRHNGRDVRDGYYTVFHLRIAPTRVVEIERDIKLNDQIIRHLITHFEPKETTGEASAEAPAEAAAEPVAPVAPAAGAAIGEAAAAESSVAPVEGDATPETDGDQPLLADASSTGEQTADAPETTAGEEQESPPVQPDPTPEEE